MDQKEEFLRRFLRWLFLYVDRQTLERLGDRAAVANTPETGIFLDELLEWLDGDDSDELLEWLDGDDSEKE